MLTAKYHREFTQGFMSGFSSMDFSMFGYRHKAVEVWIQSFLFARMTATEGKRALSVLPFYPLCKFNKSALGLI